MSSQERHASVREDTIETFRSMILDWFRDNGKTYPWREAITPYAILVAEVFLQRTQAKQVVPVYERFVARFPSPADLAAADVREIETIILPLGLRKRAKQLKELALQLVERHRGEVPGEYEELTDLTGVGQYTARAVLVFAFQHPNSLIDANIIRILGRVFGVSSRMKRPNTDPYLWDFVAEIIPANQARHFGWALIDFGNSICKARHPHCLDCPLPKLCRSRDEQVNASTVV